MVADAILDFQKFKILTVFPLPGANMQRLAIYFIKIGATVAEIWRFNGLLKMAPTATTHDNHLVVSIVVPNLVKIDGVVLIT